MNSIHMRSDGNNNRSDGNDGNDGEKVYTKNFVILTSAFSFLGGCFLTLLIEHIVVHEADN